MTALSDWLAMGGYATFVWPAYGIAAVALGGLAVFCWHRHRVSAAELDALSGPSGPRR